MTLKTILGNPGKECVLWTNFMTTLDYIRWRLGYQKTSMMSSMVIESQFRERVVSKTEGVNDSVFTSTLC